MPQIPLKELFPRLFSLSRQQYKFIVEMAVWDSFAWKWTFEWR